MIFRISVTIRSNWIQWQLLMHLVNFSDNSSFCLMLEGVKLSNVNWTCLYVLIKVPVWFSSPYISFVWALKVLEKSLNLILINGQEPCILVLFFFFLLFLLGWLLQKKLKAPSFQIGSDEICLDCTWMLHVQDGGNDVILCRKVLPPGECIHSVGPARMQQYLPVPDP